MNGQSGDQPSDQSNSPNGQNNSNMSPTVSFAQDIIDRSRQQQFMDYLVGLHAEYCELQMENQLLDIELAMQDQMEELIAQQHEQAEAEAVTEQALLEEAKKTLRTAIDQHQTATINYNKVRHDATLKRDEAIAILKDVEKSIAKDIPAMKVEISKMKEVLKTKVADRKSHLRKATKEHKEARARLKSLEADVAHEEAKLKLQITVEQAVALRVQRRKQSIATQQEIMKQNSIALEKLRGEVEERQRAAKHFVTMQAEVESQLLRDQEARNVSVMEQVKQARSELERLQLSNETETAKQVIDRERITGECAERDRVYEEKREQLRTVEKELQEVKLEVENVMNAGLNSMTLGSQKTSIAVPTPSERENTVTDSDDISETTIKNLPPQNSDDCKLNTEASTSQQHADLDAVNTVHVNRIQSWLYLNALQEKSSSVLDAMDRFTIPSISDSNESGRILADMIKEEDSASNVGNLTSKLNSFGRLAQTQPAATVPRTILGATKSKTTSQIVALYKLGLKKQGHVLGQDTTTGDAASDATTKADERDERMSIQSSVHESLASGSLTNMPAAERSGGGRTPLPADFHVATPSALLMYSMKYHNAGGVGKDAALSSSHHHESEENDDDRASRSSDHRPKSTSSSSTATTKTSRRKKAAKETEFDALAFFKRAR